MKIPFSNILFFEQIFRNFTSFCLSMMKTDLMIRDAENQFIPLLQRCNSIIQLKTIHAAIIKATLSQSNYLITKIIDICNLNGQIKYSTLVFNQVTQPNVFLYNAIIRAYTQNHLYTKSIDIFRRMLGSSQPECSVCPDRFTFPFILKACTGIPCLRLGIQIHCHLFKFGLSSNSVAENTLVDMYTKCDDLSSAHKVFDEMVVRDLVSWNTLIFGHARLGQLKKAKSLFDSIPQKNIVTWTALISGYNRIACYFDALDTFHLMQLSGIKPDEIAIVAILPSLSQLGALDLGKWVHTYSAKNGLLEKICICNALLEMYAKCGRIDFAHQLFAKMCQRDLISWSTMINGFAHHGRSKESIEMFMNMKKHQIKPNSITFLGVLSACTHAGLLTEGFHYFHSMTKDYNINPSVEHCGCMVDLLGRLGHLNQAIEFIHSMAITPDSTIWGSLLNSCRTHGNIRYAITAMENLIELEPDDIGNYVLLSNAYANVGHWEGVSKVRKMMRYKRMKKIPGCSLIEVNNVVQEFVAGDNSNALTEEICWMLVTLASEIKEIDAMVIIEIEE